MPIIILRGEESTSSKETDKRKVPQPETTKGDDDSDSETEKKEKDHEQDLFYEEFGTPGSLSRASTNQSSSPSPRRKKLNDGKPKEKEKEKEISESEKHRQINERFKAHVIPQEELEDLFNFKVYFESTPNPFDIHDKPAQVSIVSLPIVNL